ncbi:MAG: hypothetical protein Fur0015_02340 [Ignavibacteriales bacterium]
MFFLILIVANITAQDKVCDYCKQKIKGEYIIVEDKFYHANHFLCGKCGKPIEGEYVENENKFYHPECYNESFVPKCDVCGQPLSGEYFQDLYGNKYHPKHLSESERCDNCDRLISERITKGGYKLSDGRSLCKLCFDDAVPSNSVYDFLLRSVIDKLRNFGVNLPNDKIKIQPVNRIGLKKSAGNEYNDRLRGYCKMENTETTFGRETKKKFNAIIYVLNKIPQDYTESIIAHELMHIWIDQNTKHRQSKMLEEGSCNFISYKIIMSGNSKNKKDILQLLLNDPDAVYGDGFRKVYEKFKSKQVVELLNYLKTNNNI